MKIIKAKMQKIEIQLSINEISALKQILNEVCHGFKVDDFENKIGASKEKVQNLLDDLGYLKKYIRQNNPIIESSPEVKKK